MTLDFLTNCPNLLIYLHEANFKLKNHTERLLLCPPREGAIKIRGQYVLGTRYTVRINYDYRSNWRSLYKMFCQRSRVGWPLPSLVTIGRAGYPFTPHGGVWNLLTFSFCTVWPENLFCICGCLKSYNLRLGDIVSLWSSRWALLRYPITGAKAQIFEHSDESKSLHWYFMFHTVVMLL